MTKPTLSPSDRYPLARTAATLATVGVALALGACSVFQESKVDYTSAKRVSTLEVPPDLTQLKAQSRYVAPGSVVTASGYQTAQPAATVLQTAANEAADVRIERAGNERWLVVKRPADKLWQPVRDFWQENGFVLIVDQEKLGLLETDWAENRAKLPQDFVRNLLGKVFDSLYSTGERDKFRTRLERTASGETEIYISHRGMVEVYSNSAKDQTIWQPRQPDPELEAEFLRRLMVKLGVTTDQAKTLLATAAPAPKARLVSAGGVSTGLELDAPFDRAWRQVGLALDRAGYTVEDRDRTNRTYFVRVVEAADKMASEPGFFSRLLGASKKDTAPAQYQIRLSSNGNQTSVVVLSAQGQPDGSAPAQNILKLLVQDLQ